MDDHGGPAEADDFPIEIEELLKRMALILEREFTAFELETAEAGSGRMDRKASVDFVTLVARTVEKIDQLMKAARAERADRRKAAGEMDTHERDEMAQRIADRLNELVEERAGRLVAENAGRGDAPVCRADHGR